MTIARVRRSRVLRVGAPANIPLALIPLPKTRDTSHKWLSPAERAKLIVAALVASKGPIVLVVPGTNNDDYVLGCGAAIQTLSEAWQGEMAIAEIPYPRDFPAILSSVADGRAVLEAVLDGLRAQAPNRPVYMLGESQGAWIAADVLTDPVRSAGITRTALFAVPGIKLATLGVGDARLGARMLTAGGKVKIIAHPDDFVASSPPNLSLLLKPNFFKMLYGLILHNEFIYDPHDYTKNGPEAAQYLLAAFPPRSSME